jgi:putative ABC transport system substrate-binding protein
MRRREIISLIGSAAVAWPLATRAQQAKVYRIGVLELVSPALNAPRLEAFRQGMREHGYIEGRDYTLEYRSADGNDERFSDLAAELVRLNVDLIVTSGTPAVLAAKNATRTIPVVMAACGEPVGVGVIASLARPGGNITGQSSQATDTSIKRVELLKELVPSATRMSGLMNMSNSYLALEWSEAERAMRSLAIDPHVFDIRTREDIERAFDMASTARTDAVLVGSDTLTQSNRQLVVELPSKYRLPAMYEVREYIEAGGLISYGVNVPELYRSAAIFLDKIFRGANPGDLPVTQPTKFELVINLKTARALGLKPPPTFMVLADEVIE